MPTLGATASLQQQQKQKQQRLQQQECHKNAANIVALVHGHWDCRHAISPPPSKARPDIIPHTKGRIEDAPSGEVSDNGDNNNIETDSNSSGLDTMQGCSILATFCGTHCLGHLPVHGVLWQWQHERRKRW